VISIKYDFPPLARTRVSLPPSLPLFPFLARRRENTPRHLRPALLLPLGLPSAALSRFPLALLLLIPRG